MPKKRQIPRLFHDLLADGRTTYHWKPSAKLRKLGFANVALGTDLTSAVNQALDLNRQVDDLGRGNTQPEPSRRILPRVVRFAELVTRYRQSDAFTSLRKATRDNYDTRLNQLSHWALDGTLPIRTIDRALVRDLRNELVANKSPWVAGSMLRVLRLLLQWAKDESLVTENVATDADIPEAPSRRVMMPRAVRDAIVEAATELGLHDIAFAIPLSLWLLQRQADIRHLARFAWRPLDLDALDLDPRHSARLVDARGRAMSFRLAQQKTGTWIDAPVPPAFHAEIERRFKVSGWLFPDIHRSRFREDRTMDRPMPMRTFQRRFQEAQEAAWAVAIMEGKEELAAAIDVVQFRDLRRTGMVFYKDAGAIGLNITALSGHYALGKRTIIDTYMPGDTAGACACVAAGIAAEQRFQLRHSHKAEA